MNPTSNQSFFIQHNLLLSLGKALSLRRRFARAPYKLSNNLTRLTGPGINSLKPCDR